MLESIQRLCLYDVYNQKYERSYKMCLTFIFKFNYQSQVNDSGFLKIHGIGNVRIDTKIKSTACIPPELRNIIQWVYLTLSSKANR